MYVRDIMRSNVITIAPRATLADAVRLTRERGVRHLPVVLDGDLIGMVSDRDLKRAMPPSGTGALAPDLAAVTVDQVMTSPVITTGPSFSVEEAGRVMVSEKISALPVTERGRLVGIVTETDVVQLLVRALGTTEPSSRLDVTVGPAGSALAEIVRAVEETGVSISSVVTLTTAEGSRQVILRLATIDARRAEAALERRGYAIRGPHRS